MGELRKVVINRCHGGFGVSRAVAERMADAGDAGAAAHLVKYPDYKYSYQPERRDDPVLVALVEELGREANGEYAALKVVEIPADVEWEIGENDGIEWVAEKHRTWA